MTDNIMMSISNRMKFLVVLISLVTGVSLFLIVSNYDGTRDNIKTIENLPKIFESNGDLSSIIITGQQRQFIIDDKDSLIDFKNSVANSHIGNDVPENQFYEYKLTVRFANGLEVILSISISKTRFIITNDQNDDFEVRRIIKIPSGSKFRIWNIASGLSKFS